MPIIFLLKIWQNSLEKPSEKVPCMGDRSLTIISVFLNMIHFLMTWFGFAFLDFFPPIFYHLKVSGVLKLCLTRCDPMDCSPPGSSVHGIPQARILEWVAISFSSGNLPDPGIEPTSLASSALAGGLFYHCATYEVQHLVVWSYIYAVYAQPLR